MGEVVSSAEELKPIRNPFKYKGSLDPVLDKAVFIPRTKLVNHILRRLADRVWFTLIGGKKVGKSSLLNEVVAQGRQVHPSWLFLLIKMKDVDYEGGEENLYREVAAEIYSQVRLLKTKVPVLRTPSEGPTEFKASLVSLARHLAVRERAVLVFDGLDAMPAKMLRRFLQVLAAIQSTKVTPEFSRYSVVVSGAFSPVDIATPGAGPFSGSSVFRVGDSCSFRWIRTADARRMTAQTRLLGTRNKMSHLHIPAGRSNG